MKITLHLYDPSADLKFYYLDLSSATLCSRPVGSTDGVIQTNRYFRPLDNELDMFEVKLTKKGVTKLNHVLRHDITIFSRCRGFFTADVAGRYFSVCSKCSEHEDFGLLLLRNL